MGFLQGVKVAKGLRGVGVQWGLVIGAVQGVLSGAVELAIDHKMPPFSNASIAVISVQMLVLIPLILSLNLGKMRPFSLAALLVGEAFISTDMALHWVWEGRWERELIALQAVIYGLLLFIVQVIARAADRDRRWVPRHTTLFDIAWEQSTSLILAMVAAAFTLCVLLGSYWFFFRVGRPGIGSFLTQPMSLYVATGMVVAGVLCADNQTMARELRDLVLYLCPILLSVISGLSIVFLLVLVVAPHTVSWKTHSVSWLISVTASVLVLLLSIVFQDARPLDQRGRLTRISARVAAVVIMLLVSLVLEPVVLHVVAHGWTVDRVLVAALLGILGFYGVGYTLAALGSWFDSAALTNVAGAGLSCIVFFGLLTSVADPRRLSVASQVSRLMDGTLSKDDFPYEVFFDEDWLYGQRALKRLIDTLPPSDGSYMLERVREISVSR